MHSVPNKTNAGKYHVINQMNHVTSETNGEESDVQNESRAVEQYNKINITVKEKNSFRIRSKYKEINSGSMKWISFPKI